MDLILKWLAEKEKFKFLSGIFPFPEGGGTVLAYRGRLTFHRMSLQIIENGSLNFITFLLSFKKKISIEKLPT